MVVRLSINASTFFVRVHDALSLLDSEYSMNTDICGIARSSFGPGWADGATITERIERSARDEFPLINEAIIGCFEGYKANLTQ